MKVMQIITKGEIGGAQTHVLSVCRALAQEVTWVAVVGGTEPDSPLAQQLTAMQVPVHRLAALGNTLAPWRVAGAVHALLTLLRQNRPDLIHAHSAVAAVVARIAGRLAGIPVVYTVHGFGFKPEVSWLRRQAVWWVEWLLAPWTAHMICVSRHEQQLARRLPLAAGRISVIHNALADRPERACPAEEPMRVIMVARFAPPKRQDLLLQALALLRQELGHELPLTLTGSGPALPAQQVLARRLGLQAVTFTGDVQDVPGLLAAHSVFVLMSDHEGLPISVIEAMRAGLAIVASDLPGVRELIDPDQQGLLVANEPQALAAALGTLARTPALRQHLGAAARQRYVDQGQPELAAQAILAVYGQMAAHESRLSAPD